MNDQWNRIIYKIWSPVYDTFFNTGPFLKARKMVFQKESFLEGQKILIVGVGTGADLDFMDHQKLHITAIDYSEDMLKKAKDKFKNSSIQFLLMDAQHMSFEDDYFDVVVGSLVLSVVPDSAQCLKEMLRVLKPNGEVIIFDKFVLAGKELSTFKKVIRPVIKRLGTDIGMNFEEIFENVKQTTAIKEDIPIMFNGMYRKITLNKRSAEK